MDFVPLKVVYQGLWTHKRRDWTTEYPTGQRCHLLRGAIAWFHWKQRYGFV